MKSLAQIKPAPAPPPYAAPRHATATARLDFSAHAQFGHRLTEIGTSVSSPGEASSETGASPAPSEIMPAEGAGETPDRDRPIQAKLAIGDAGDSFEKEADIVTARLAAAMHAPAPALGPLGPRPGMAATPVVQRAGAGAGLTAPAHIEAGIAAARGSGQALSEMARGSMEQSLGVDLGGVRVHSDARSDALSRSIQARAFTTGQDVFFRQGAYDPGSRGGQELLAHEITHVVQQGSAPGIVQRYYEPDNSTSPYTLTPDTGPGARNPFTSFESDLSTQPATGGKAVASEGWTKHTHQPTDSLPPLRVAGDNTLAIQKTNNEPKEFYATSGVISAANSALAGVKSPIELSGAGNQITIPGTTPATLTMVQPHLRGETAPGREEFINLTTDICRDVAQKITGGSYNQAVLSDSHSSEKTLAPLSTSNSQTISGTHSLAEELTKGDVTTQEGAAAVEGEKKAPQVGQDYGTSLRPDIRGKEGEGSRRAQAIGLNEAAKPGVGQAYATQSIFNADTSKTDYAISDTHVNNFIWGYHFGAVVAESGDGQDQITMENYNRSSDMSAARTAWLTSAKTTFTAELAGLTLGSASEAEQVKMIEDRINQGLQKTGANADAFYKDEYKKHLNAMGSRWYFRIVGTGKGQSFHEQMASSGYFANPMTLAVTKSERGMKPIDFDEGDTATPNSVGKNNLAAATQSIISDTRNGHPPSRIKLDGLANGWKNTGVGAEETSLQRAQTVAALLTTGGVDVRLIQVSGAGRRYTDSVVKNRRVEMTIEG